MSIKRLACFLRGHSGTDLVVSPEGPYWRCARCGIKTAGEAVDISREMIRLKEDENYREAENLLKEIIGNSHFESEARGRELVESFFGLADLVTGGVYLRKYCGRLFIVKPATDDEILDVQKEALVTLTEFFRKMRGF